MATDGMLLISKTGDVPIWATLTDGNNITSTEGANSISIAVTGTTEHAVQIGSAAGALTSLAVGTDGQVASRFKRSRSNFRNISFY